MTSLIKQKNQSETRLIIYYQGFLAVAAILVFFTRLDVYLQDHLSIIPLYWLIGFLLASLPLFISLFNRFEDISINILVWSGVYIALSLISILIQPTFPDQQFLEDQYRTIIFLEK